MNDVEQVDYRAAQRQQWDEQYDKSKSSFLKNICCYIFFLLPPIICLIIAGSGTWGGATKGIVIAAVIVKFTLNFPLEITYLLLMKYYIVSPNAIKLFKLFMILPILGWHIAVVVTFFSSKNNWDDEEVALYVAHVILVVEAFLMFLFVILLIWICICLIGLLCIMHRSATEERRKNVKFKNILLGAASMKLNVNELNEDDQWAICFDNFDANQQIVRLPCDKRHHFHAECIGPWLEQQRNCPIWKATFDENTLQRMKSNRALNVANNANNSPQRNMQNNPNQQMHNPSQNPNNPNDVSV